MKEWQYVKLGDVCTKDSSNIAQKDLGNNNGEYPIYGASGFIKNVDFFQQEKEYIAIVKDGAGVGRAMLLPAKSSVIGTMQYIIPDNQVNIKYLYYAIENMNLAKYYSGATIPHIYFKDYQKEVFKCPNSNEQERIASVLDKIVLVIEKRKQQLQNLDELVKARFVEMFGDFVYEKEKWDVTNIGEIADTIDPHPSHRTPPIYTSGIPYVGIAECDYTTNKIDFENARKVSKDVLVEHITRYDINYGDFIIGKIGTIGKPFLLPTEREYALSANTVLIKPNKEKVAPRYLFSFFQSAYMDKVIDAEKKSTSQPAFGIQKVRSVEMPLPPLCLQRKYDLFAQQIDKSKLHVQKSLDKLEILKKALMQKYFG